MRSKGEGEGERRKGTEDKEAGTHEGGKKKKKKWEAAREGTARSTRGHTNEQGKRRRENRECKIGGATRVGGGVRRVERNY